MLNYHKLEKEGYTYFLDPKEFKDIKGKLKKNEYHVYYPYKDSEKILLYKNTIPTVLLYEIKAKTTLRHQDLLGTMYSLSISPELFGDILLIEGKYYIYILPIVRNYFESNFLKVRNSSVEVIERDLSLLENYEREYESLEFIVSSNRIDTVISTISHTNRKNISDMIQKREILLNHDYLKDASYKLKDEDIFSIKRIGKFCYKGIIKETKGNHLIINILKYQ